ncbi:MAG TPA: hypothetical protein VFS98_10925 [Methylomirabilota bacterium]|nr:hypothetical protein [Methylomirabilota bacterium]
MPGPKRRKVIAVLIFLQALLFGSTTPVGTYTLQFAFGKDAVGHLGPGWHATEGELALEQVFALAVAIIVGVLIWRGLPAALHSVAALAALSVLFDLIFIAAQWVQFGPIALLFLIIFPLPTVPPAAIGIPVLILSASIILDMWRQAHPAAGRRHARHAPAPDPR